MKTQKLEKISTMMKMLNKAKKTSKKKPLEEQPNLVLARKTTEIKPAIIF